ncbi:MAG: hypothetical protein ACKVS8_10995 [Phycisphaerales bacterium]
MITLILYISEWPWILLVMLAVYLAFEHWRFPDLTIEASFTAGMTAVHFALTHATTTTGRLSLFVLLAGGLPLLLSLATWSLSRLRLAPLFAGLLVTLAAYSLNYHLNGSQTAQGLDLATAPASWKHLTGLNSSEISTILFLVTALALAAAFCLFDTSRLGRSILLARRTQDPAAAVAIGLHPGRALFAGMCVYNSIAFMGGAGFAVQNSFSGVSFIAAITPGIAGMFAVRAIKQHAGAPSVSRPPSWTTTVVRALLRWSDSTSLVVLSIVALSLLVTLMRFEIRGRAGPGMLNAYTAAATIGLWILLATGARLIGKRVTGADDHAG